MNAPFAVLDLEGGGEELGFPIGQEILTALGNGEGGGKGVGGAGGYWEEGRKWKECFRILE